MQTIHRRSRAFDLFLVCVLSLTCACSSGGLSGRVLADRQPLFATDAALERVLTDFGATAAPLWMPQGYLLFTDLASDTIRVWNEPQRPIVMRREAGRPVAQRRNGEGGIVSAHANGRVTVTGEGGRLTVLADAVGDRALNGPVDVAMGPEGSVYFVDRGVAGEGHAAQIGSPATIYRIDSRGTVAVLSRALGAPNGLAFSPDMRWLYVTDATEGGVFRFAVHADGALGAPERFVQMRAGPGERQATGAIAVHPVTGTLFVCGPGGVWAIAPAGKTVGRLAVPERTTGVALGGRDGRSLFITAGKSVYRMRLRHATTGGA